IGVARRLPAAGTEASAPVNASGKDGTAGSTTRRGYLAATWRERW
ncbi:MAG: hypothetical protein QOH52_2815, partial [Pseudonocardiales bacterium]|nr:hypothetical protein [Pseudonocardiales bacterium]